MHLAIVMPSRKKAKGKARRAAKEAKATQEMKEETAVVANQDGSIGAQMQRLTINHLLRESDAVQCRHGCKGERHDEILYRKVLVAFERAYEKSFSSGKQNITSCFNAGIHAMRNFAEFLDDVARFRQLVSYIVAEAVRLILDGNDRDAGIIASFTCFFEQRIAVNVEKTQPQIKWLQIVELQHSDLHTLVKFLRKRIPCKCLDNKYKEVKSVTKMGVCCNNECFLSGKKVAQSELFYCDSCRAVCYCSADCQKAHWSRHKSLCKQLTLENAKFYNK